MEIKNYGNENDFKTFFDKVSLNIFNKELQDIIEITYAYKELGNGKIVNKTLFGTFLNNNGDDQYFENVSKYISDFYNKVLIKLQTKKQLISSYKKDILNFDKSNSKIQILSNTLDYVENILNLTITGLPFEAEKAGMILKFSKEQIDEKVFELENIEKKLFGGNVRDNEYELKESYKIFVNLFNKNKELLNDLEKEKYLNYISILGVNKIDINENINSKNSEENIFDKEISRGEYIKVFNLVFEIYNINKLIIVDERSSIYDGEDALYIPNSPAYDNLKLKRVLALIQHEIETHYIIEKNNKKTLGFRGAGNLEREEGLAVISEGILSGKNIYNDFGVSGAIPTILMGELLDGDDFKDFLSLHQKLTKTNNLNGIFLRRKRNYPLNYKGVQHKDVTYNRGQHKVIEYVKKGRDIKDLYLVKASIDDILLLKKDLEYSDSQITYPLLIGEILQYFINKNTINEKDFILYIESKYPFLNVLENLKNGTINRLSFYNKRKIIEILSIIK